MIGLVIDLTLFVLPALDGLAVRWVALLGGIVLVGAGSGFYLNAALGPGARDGLIGPAVAASIHFVRPREPAAATA